MGLFDFLKKKKPASAAASKPAPARPAPAAPRTFQPYTGTGVCDVCNGSLSGKQAWIVPNDVFYASPKYKQWHRDMMARMGMSAMQADAAINQMRMMDTSPGSAVCENCIHMFR